MGDLFDGGLPLWRTSGSLTDFSLSRPPSLVSAKKCIRFIRQPMVICCATTHHSIGQSFPATDESIGKKLINKCRTTGGEVKWIRAHHLKDGLGNEPFRLFNKVFATISTSVFFFRSSCSVL